MSDDDRVYTIAPKMSAVDFILLDQKVRKAFWDQKIADRGGIDKMFEGSKQNNAFLAGLIKGDK